MSLYHFCPQFTVRRLMVAVALSPIVIVSAIKASDTWGTQYTIISVSSRTINQWEIEASVGMRKTFTPWPAVAAVVGSTLMVGVAWSFVEWMMRRRTARHPRLPLDPTLVADLRK